jgi:DNA polymerase III epsilon subunit-like protein
MLFIDIETTGLDPRAEGAAVLEVAWASAGEDGRLVSAYSTLCRPPEGAVLTEEAARVNGLSLELCRAEGLATWAWGGHLLRAARGLRVVAHYAQFEGAWLAAEAEREGGHVLQGLLRRPWLCSKAAVRSADALLGLSGSTSLGAACERYGVAYADAHTALGDALSCARLWAALRARVVASAGAEGWRQVEAAAVAGAALELGVGR